MKKQINLIFLAALCGLNCYSQITFEKGYYIDNSNCRVECLIRNNDWESNPSKFVYILSDSAEQQTLSIDSVKEFSIPGKFKYKRFTVEIDRSSDLIEKIDNNINPVFTEEVLFLKVLVEGKANLYMFSGEGLIRYFFNIDSSGVKQLVYKSYYNSDHQIKKNFLFRQQLLESLTCQEISFNNIQKIEYKQKDLVNLFEKYNGYNNSEFIILEENHKRDLFNLTPRPGIKHSSLYIQNSAVYFNDIDFGSKNGARFGLEAEFILPFNNNKWAMFIEPTYQYFKSTVTKVSNVTTGEGVTAYADYKSIELPLGLRYYLFLDDKSKLFINATYIYDFCFNSSINIIKTNGSTYHYFKIHSEGNFAVGLGYKYSDRYSIEIRYHTERVLLGNYPTWSSNYKTFSIILGYSFF